MDCLTIWWEREREWLYHRQFYEYLYPRMHDVLKKKEGKTAWATFHRSCFMQKMIISLWLMVIDCRSMKICINFASLLFILVDDVRFFLKDTKKFNRERSHKGIHLNSFNSPSLNTIDNCSLRLNDDYCEDFKFISQVLIALTNYCYYWELRARRRRVRDFIAKKVKKAKYSLTNERRDTLACRISIIGDNSLSNVTWNMNFNLIKPSKWDKSLEHLLVGAALERTIRFHFFNDQKLI